MQSDQTSSNAHGIPSDHHLLRRYAACVERTGLGSAFRRRAQKDNAMSQSSDSLNTEASSNGIHGNGLLNAGRIGGNSLTGLSGARSEQQNQFHYHHNHFGSGNFYAATSLDASNSSKHVMGASYEHSNEKTPRTSLEPIHPVTAAARASAGRETDSDRESQNDGPQVPQIRLPETGPHSSDQSSSSSDSEEDFIVEARSTEQYIRMIETRGFKATQSFGEILGLLPSHVRHQQDVFELVKSVKEQQCFFENHQTSLPDVIRRVASQSPQKMSHLRTWDNVLERLDELQRVLDAPKLFIGERSKRKLREGAGVSVSISESPRQ